MLGHYQYTHTHTLLFLESFSQAFLFDDGQTVFEGTDTLQEVDQDMVCVGILGGRLCVGRAFLLFKCTFARGLFLGIGPGFACRLRRDGFNDSRWLCGCVATTTAAVFHVSERE